MIELKKTKVLSPSNHDVRYSESEDDLLRVMLVASQTQRLSLYNVAIR
jgi:hypothetical protein